MKDTTKEGLSPFFGFLIFFTVLCIIVAAGWKAAQLLEKRDLKLRQRANEAMQVGIEAAKAETGDPCSHIYFRIVEAPRYSTMQRTVVVAGQVAEPIGSVDLGGVSPRFYETSDNPYYQDLIRSKVAFEASHCPQNKPR